MAVFAHHYLFDAASMLDDCIDKLQKTIDQDLKGHYYALYDMKEVLVSTEHLLHRYLVQILEIEKKDHGRKNATATAHREAASTSIMGTMTELKETLKEKQRQKEELHRRKIHFRNPQDPVSVQKNSLYNSGRSATDTLLFRLIVALQLCLVRIGDAHVVLTGRRIGVSTQDGEQNLGRRILILTGCCLIGAGVSLRDHQQLGGRKLQQLSTGIENQKIALGTLAKIGTALAIGAWVKSKINTMWVTEKIIQSSNEVEEWVKQWQVVQSTVSPGEKVDQLRMPGQRTYIKPTTELQPSGLLDEKSRRLIEYAMKHGPKVFYYVEKH